MTLLNCGKCIAMLALLFSLGSVQAKSLPKTEIIGDPIASGTFQLLLEPSGIALLGDGTFIVVEDEASRPLSRLQLQQTETAEIGFEEYKQVPAEGFINRRLLSPLDDLEGIAKLTQDSFFIIGSHENAERGERPAREKLVMLTRDGFDIVSAKMRTDLFDKLQEQYPDVFGRARFENKPFNFNIEGLAYDRKRNILLVGLRSPLTRNDAIIVSLENAVQYLNGDEPDFSAKLHIFDLDKGGIRALAYDDQSDKLLIVSERDKGKNKGSAFWTLEADKMTELTQYHHKDKKLFENVEGLTIFSAGVLFVRDNGGVTKKNDNNWFALERSQLNLNN